MASAWGIVLDVLRVQFGCASPLLEEVLQALVGVFRGVWVDWLHPKHGDSLGPHHTACLHASINTQPIHVRGDLPWRVRSLSCEASGAPSCHQPPRGSLLKDAGSLPAGGSSSQVRVSARAFSVTHHRALTMRPGKRVASDALELYRCRNSPPASRYIL